MKQINNFVHEGISKDLKERIIQLLQDEKLTNDDGQYILNTISSVEYSKGGDDPDSRASKFNLIKWYLASRNYGGTNQRERAYDEFIAMLQKSGTKNFQHFIKNVMDFENSDDLANPYKRKSNGDLTTKSFAEAGEGQISNVYDFFKSYELSEDFLKKLANITYAVGSTAQGIFENLLNVLLSDTGRSYELTSKQKLKLSKGEPVFSKISRDGAAGDVKGTLAFLELKGPGARIKGQKLQSAKSAQQNFDRSIAGLIYQTDVNPKEIQYNPIFGVDGNNDPKAFETFLELLTYGLDKDTIYDLLSQVFADQLQLNIQKDIKTFLKDTAVLDDIGNKKEFCKKWRKILGTIHLYGYQKQEHWDYLILFVGKTGAAAIDKGQYLTISANEALDMKTVFESNRYHFSGYLKDSSGWDDTVHIYAGPDDDSDKTSLDKQNDRESKAPHNK